jgi:Icc protein
MHLSALFAGIFIDNIIIICFSYFAPKHHTMSNIKLDRKSFLRSLALAGAVVGLPSVALRAADEKKPAAKRSLRVAHITDIHVMPGRVPEYGMAQALHGVNDAADKADFVIAGGDMVMDTCSGTRDKARAMWQTFHGIMKSDNSLDVHHTIGNHDLYNISVSAASFPDAKRWACEELQIPKQYYSFDKGRWRFVILDSVHKKIIPGYVGKLDEEQLDWLKKTLAETPADMYVCVVSHIPILAVCTVFDGAKVKTNVWRMSGGNMHEDAKVLKDLFYQSGKVKACLSGHIHLIDELDYCGTKYYCNGAVSGSWWNGIHQEFPPAFAMMNFYDDGSSSRELHFYKWQA